MSKEVYPGRADSGRGLDARAIQPQWALPARAPSGLRDTRGAPASRERSGLARVVRRAASISIALLLASVGSAHAAVGAVPAAALERARSEGSARVVVQLATQPAKGRSQAGPASGQAAQAAQERRQGIATAQSAVISELAGTDHRVLRRFEGLPFLALAADEAALAALEASDAVVAVQLDRLARPALSDSVPLVEADQAWSAGYDGSGWTVGVVDTGVDSEHPMLEGKVVAEACFSAEASCPNGRTQQTGSGAAAPCSYASQDCGHGTHVAGVAAGSWPEGELYGVARGASVIAVQVFSRFSGSQCGSGGGTCALAYLSDIAAGIEHVASLRDVHRVAAVNLSLGSEFFRSQASCDAANALTKAAIDELASAGIAAVAAAGNDGDSTGLQAPACISSAIGVGSTSKGDVVSEFSDSATFLSLLAPGESIRSAASGGGTAIVSGTSEAAPHVSGAWAILKQKSPAATVDELLEALRSTGLSIHDSRNGVSTSRIRVAQALDALQGSTRQSGIQVTPDGKRTLISKDVSGARWAITYDHDDGTAIGNVYPSSGGEPQFVWCEPTASGASADEVQLACWGADPCGDSCGSAPWGFLSQVTLPRSFFEAPQ